MNNNNCLTLKNVSKKIKDKYILKDINLTLEGGKIYGFKGKNGSGKTMLLRAICGLITTEGEIVVNNSVIGKDISFPESVGALIEYPSFMDYETGVNNLRYLASIKGNINDDQIKEAICKVGLEPNDKRKVKKYSLGMKQRLGIAQAIMEDPEQLILDEPTNALDDSGTELFEEIVLGLKGKGKIILIASHDREQLQKICDTIFTIQDGEITNCENKGSVDI